METLISFMGGDETAESRFDAMFIPGFIEDHSAVGSGGSNGVGSTLFNPGNEPSFATPFLYHYFTGGRQLKSVHQSREIVNEYYSTTPQGLPGISDAGAIDSRLIWNLIGLYPVVTQPVYLILSPWFSGVNVSVGNGKYMHITAQGVERAGRKLFCAESYGQWSILDSTLDQPPGSECWRIYGFCLRGRADQLGHWKSATKPWPHGTLIDRPHGRPAGIACR